MYWRNNQASEPFNMNYRTTHTSEAEREFLRGLMKGGNATKAFKAAESLRVALKELNLAHPHSTVSDIITMSMGLSSIYPSDSNNMKILMAKANDALSDAKLAGQAQLSVN